jgi:hypothetical protein
MMNWDEWGCPIRRTEVWLRRAEKENALYDPTSASVHLLNETALAIWDLCDGETRPEEMIEAVCELTGTHRDVVSEDVERILMEFNSAHLIHWTLATHQPADPSMGAS